MRIKDWRKLWAAWLLERNARQVALTRFGRFETASALNP
jgi:hypothetical protein